MYNFLQIFLNFFQYERQSIVGSEVLRTYGSKGQLSFYKSVVSLWKEGQK